MGDLLILNGSPRAPRSHSKHYAQMVSAYYPGTTEYCDITKTSHQALCGKVGEYSKLLFVFPLYADAIPVSLLNFLKALEVQPPEKKPVVSVLINCGFLEPQQNDVAIEMMRLFCRQNQYPFGAVLKIGSGEAILDSPFRFLAARKIRRFADVVARGEYETLQVTMPLPKKMFAAAAETYWKNYGRKHGVTKEQMETMKIES